MHGVSIRGRKETKRQSERKGIADTYPGVYDELMRSDVESKTGPLRNLV